MEPIISPWLIYLVSLLNKIFVAAVITVSILGVGVLISGAGYLLEDNETAHNFLHKVKWPFILSIIALVVIPDKQTLLTMLAAQYITPDNLQAVQGNIVEFVGQIAQAVKDVK